MCRINPKHICNCPCHLGRGMHIVACCKICPECGYPIQTKYISEHNNGTIIDSPGGSDSDRCIPDVAL